MCTCQTVDGQCISSCLHQQDGRYPFPKSVDHCNQPVGMVLSASVSGASTTSSRRVECESRPGILSNRRFQQLETQSGSVPVSSQKVGPFPGRPICIPADKSITQICQLEARSILSGLGKYSGVCLSPVCPNRSLFMKVDHLVLVAPVWPTQPWYPLLLQTSVDLPVLIPPSPQLLSKGELLHPLTNLQLAGWRLSAKSIKHQNFQRKLQRFYWQPGDKILDQPMPPPGVSGLAGVVNEKLIHFQHL